MKVLYNGWERWITTTGSDIKIEDGSKKTFKTVIATWREDTSHNLKKGEGRDDEESWGFEGRYSSRSRHSLEWQNGMHRENTSGESKEEEEGDGDDSDGDYQKSPPLFVVAKAGGSDINSADVVESPAKYN